MGSDPMASSRAPGTVLAHKMCPLCLRRRSVMMSRAPMAPAKTRLGVTAPRARRRATARSVAMMAAEVSAGCARRASRFASNRWGFAPTACPTVRAWSADKMAAGAPVAAVKPERCARAAPVSAHPTVPRRPAVPPMDAEESALLARVTTPRMGARQTRPVTLRTPPQRTQAVPTLRTSSPTARLRMWARSRT